MTDKEKFRKEVEKLKSSLIHGACSSQIAMETMCKEEAYNEVLAILDTMQEEPVSEELEEAAKNHAVERYRVTRDMVLAEKCKWSFQTGAKWKEKQMMSKAVDAHVNYAWSGLSFGGFDWSKTGLDIGDKCKLIIIKED